MTSPAAFPRSLSALFPALALALLALGPVAAADAAPPPSAPVQPAGTYSCRPVAPHAPAPPSSANELEYQGPRPCPPGDVPVARISGEEAESVPPGPPGSGTRALLGINYQYAFDKAKSPGKNLNYLGIRATTTVATPVIGAADYHSLGQLWLLDEFETTFSDVELGWTVDPGLNGDSKPHLFSFTFDSGAPGCYNGTCGSYVQVSGTTFPGMLLSSGTSLKLEVRRELGNWWLGVNGAWMGYYKPANWAVHVPAEPDVFEAGGEIASSAGSPCADMGSGAFPTETSGTTFWQVALAQLTFSGWKYLDVSRNLIATDEFGWRAIKSTKDSTAFNYGGPGYC